MKKVFTIIALVLVCGLTSCKKDDDPTKAGTTSSGAWTAKVGGSGWTAGKIEKKGYTASEDFIAYRDNDKSVMVFSFPGTAAVGTFPIPEVNGASIGYYGDISNSSTMENGQEGEIKISKYTADSLVATFNFKTPSLTFTEGKIKIKLN
jgi:hypothetical protein